MISGVCIIVPNGSVENNHLSDSAVTVIVTHV